MRRNTWHVFMAVALIGLMNAAAAYAEEVNYLANNEMASLRAELEALEARWDASSYGAGFGSGYDDCCRDAGWFVGAELALLRPLNGNGTGFSSVFALAGTADVGGINPSYSTAPRLWLGYRKSDGLGIRVRYWQFDQLYTTAASGGAIGGAFAVGSFTFHSFDTWVLDAEVIDSSKLGCNWEATYSVGLRHLQYTEIAGVTNAAFTQNIIATTDTDAVGVTSSIELRRDISCRLGIFGTARGSILYGDETNSASGLPVLGLRVDNQVNDIKAIYELQMGIEYVKPVTHGTFFVRAGFEAQYWDGFGVDNQPLTRGNVLLPSSNTSAGFVGGFFAVGFNR